MIKNKPITSIGIIPTKIKDNFLFILNAIINENININGARITILIII